MVKDQVVMVYRNTDGAKWWEYGVVVSVFDKHVEVITRSGYNPLWLISDEDKEWSSGNCTVKELTINGKPVMTEKTLFGNRKYRGVKFPKPR